MELEIYWHPRGKKLTWRRKAIDFGCQVLWGATAIKWSCFSSIYTVVLAVEKSKFFFSENFSLHEISICGVNRIHSVAIVWLIFVKDDRINSWRHLEGLSLTRPFPNARGAAQPAHLIFFSISEPNPVLLWICHNIIFHLWLFNIPTKS